MKDKPKTTLRKLTENEFLYCWYIEYGDPYHYIAEGPEIAATIKGLIDAGICIYLPNPIKPVGSPLYCRFTLQGRMLFLAHECLMLCRHPTQLEEGSAYDAVIGSRDFERVVMELGGVVLKYLSKEEGEYG